MSQQQAEFKDALKFVEGIVAMGSGNVAFSTSKRAAVALGIAMTLVSAGSAFALGTPEQRRACTPDVYRLCAGEIPNVRAITACLVRQKGNLSPSCRSAMEQNGY